MKTQPGDYQPRVIHLCKNCRREVAAPPGVAPPDPVDCRACTTELLAERVEMAIPEVITGSLALPAELKNDVRLADLLEAISMLSSAGEVDGECACDWCMNCHLVTGDYRVLPADRILALRRGELAEVLVRKADRFSKQAPYAIGQVIGALETWGQGQHHDEIFWNDAAGASCSRLDWVDLHPSDDEENDPHRAIWYYADGEPPSADSDYRWDKSPAAEMEPSAVRVWFRVVGVEYRDEGFENLWVLRCELAEKPAQIDPLLDGCESVPLPSPDPSVTRPA